MHIWLVIGLEIVSSNNYESWIFLFQILESSSNSSWLLVGSWLFCLQNLPCLVSFWCMRGGSVEVWTKKFYFGSCRVKLILACQEVLKWVWPFMNRYRMVFCSNLHTTPRMHQKLTKHGRFCKQNNQLPTKNHDVLEDYSIDYWSWDTQNY
jgi:hypothetical protein